MGWKPEPRWDKTNRYWYCHVRGKRHYLAATEPDARRRFAELAPQLGLGDDGPIRFVADLIVRWLRDNDVDFNRRCLLLWNEHAGAVPLEEVAADHLERFAAWLAKRKFTRGKSKTRHPLKPKTIRHHAFAAARVLRWAHERKLIRDLPKRPKLANPERDPHGYTDAELKALFDSLSNNRHADRICRFILATGCRPSEARGLRWDMLRETPAGAMFVLADHKTVDTTGAPRKIYLNAETRAIVEERKGVRRGPVFVNREGAAYTMNTLSATLTRRGFSVYRLRHTFAGRALRSVGLERAAKLMGHVDTSTMRHYAQLEDAEALAAAAALV